MRDDFTEQFGEWGGGATVKQPATEPIRDDFTEQFGEWGGGEITPAPAIEEVLPEREALVAKEKAFYEEHPPETLELTPTGETTKFGMPVFKDQFDAIHSESTETFEVEVHNQRGREIKWVTAPVIWDGKYQKQPFVANLLKENNFKNPTTGEDIPLFDTVEEAEKYAVDRDMELQQPDALRPLERFGNVGGETGKEQDGPAADTIFTETRKQLSKWVDELPGVFKPSKIAIGTLETMAEFVSGFAASVPAGLAGIYTLAVNKGDYKKAEEVVGMVHDAYTAEVQTKYGKDIKGLADIPFKAYTDFTAKIVESDFVEYVQGGSVEEEPLGSAILKAILDGPAMLLLLHKVNTGVVRAAQGTKKFVVGEELTSFDPLYKRTIGKGFPEPLTIEQKFEQKVEDTRTQEPFPKEETSRLLGQKQKEIQGARELREREIQRARQIRKAEIERANQPPGVKIEPAPKAPVAPPEEPPPSLVGKQVKAPSFEEGGKDIEITIRQGEDGFFGQYKDLRVTDIEKTEARLIEQIEAGNIDYTGLPIKGVVPKRPPPEEPPADRGDPIATLENLHDQLADITIDSLMTGKDKVEAFSSALKEELDFLRKVDEAELTPAEKVLVKRIERFLSKNKSKTITEKSKVQENFINGTIYEIGQLGAEGRKPPEVKPKEPHSAEAIEKLRKQFEGLSDTRLQEQIDKLQAKKNKKGELYGRDKVDLSQLIVEQKRRRMDNFRDLIDEVESKKVSQEPTKPFKKGKEGKLGLDQPLKTGEKELDFEYGLIEADQLIASNKADFSENPKFPEFVQERLRSGDKPQQDIIKEQVRNPEMDRITSDDPTATNGPSIVLDSGHMAGGNGRELIQLRLEETAKGAALVKKAWVAAAEKFGFTKREVGALKKPRIVRVLKGSRPDIERLTDIVAVLNKSATREKTPSELAVSQGRAISEASLQAIGVAVASGKRVIAKDKKSSKTIDKTIAEALDDLGMEFMQKLVKEGVFTEDQISLMFDQTTGRFTARGKQEISDLLVGRFLGDANLLKATPPSVRQKLAQVAPSLLKLQTKEAKAEGFDITGDLKLALRNAIKAWTRHGGKVNAKDAMRQTSLIPGEGDLAPMGREALSLFKTLLNETPARFGQRIRRYSEDVPRSGQKGMFGGKVDAEASFAEHFGDLLTKKEAKDAAEAIERGDIIDPKDSAEHAADDIVYASKVKNGSIFGTKDQIDGERVFPEQPMGMEEFLKQDFQSDRLVYVGPPVKMPKKETGMIIRRIFEGVRDKIKRGSARPDSITEYLRNRFKVSIEEGGVTGGKGVSGQYRSWIRSIRLRRRGHIDTLMHEIGHHFSEMNQGVRDIYKDKALEAEIVGDGTTKHRGLIPRAYDNLPLNARKEEGFAEYIRLYTTMRPLAREAAPGFTLRFEEFLDKTPVHRAILDEVTVAIHDWMGLDGRQRVRAKMGGIPFTELVKRFDFNKWWSAQMSSVLTRIGEITRLEELHKQGGFKLEAKDSPRNIAQINFGTSDVYKSFVMDGPMPFDIGKRGDPANIGKSLEAIFKPIKEAGEIEFFEEFLVIAQATVNAKRNLEFLYTKQEIKIFLDLFGRQPKEKQAMFAKAAQEIDVFNKAVLKYAEDGGAIKAEAAEAMRSYMYFVPFWRVSDSFLPKFLKGVKGPGGKAFIKRKGGTGNIGSPIMDLFQNHANIIKYTNRNALERRVFEIIRGSQLKKTANASTAQLAEVVPTPKELVKIRTEEVIEQYKRQGIELTRTDPVTGETVFLVPEAVVEEMGIMMQFFRPKLEGLKPNMRIMKDKNANPFVVKFTKEGEGLLNDLVNQEVRRMPFIDSWVAPVARIKRATVVLDLAFMARNFSRDMVASWVQSKTKLKPGIASVKGGIQIAIDTEMAKMMRRMGVGIGSFSHVGGQTKLEFTKERIASITGWNKGTIILKPWELASRGVRTLERFGNVTELASRVSEFDNTIMEAARQGGATEKQIVESRQTGKFKDLFKDEDSFANAITQATVNAREVAVEFHDIGTGYLMQALARTVPFFGPRVQGLRKGTRTLFGKGEGNKRVAWAKGVTGITVPFLLASVWNELWGGKDGAPAGRDREDWDKNNWLTVYNNDKPVFRLPIPWEIGTIFGVGPARLFDEVVQRMDGDPNRQDFLIGLNSSLWNVIGGFPWPTAALVPYELNDNYNRFLERPIESAAQEGKIPGERTSLYTPEILKSIGSKYDISPLKMDHAVRGFFSAFGVLTLAGVDWATSIGEGDSGIVDPSSFAGNNSVNRVFFPDANRESSRAVAEFYKMYTRVLQMEKSAKDHVKKSDVPTEAEKRFIRNNPNAQITPKDIRGAAAAAAENAADWLREVRKDMEYIKLLPTDAWELEGMNKGEIIKWKNTELLKLKKEKVAIAQKALIDVEEINKITRDINKKARLDEKKKTVEQKFAENVENTRTQE